MNIKEKKEKNIKNLKFCIYTFCIIFCQVIFHLIAKFYVYNI